MKAKKNVQPAATAPHNPFGSLARIPASQLPAVPSGAAEAAGVLTAVDEDEEEWEEAPVPDEFDYYSSEEEGDDGEQS
jgi:26S proteasome regulatory subunit N2